MHRLSDWNRSARLGLNREDWGRSENRIRWARTQDWASSVVWCGVPPLWSPGGECRHTVKYKNKIDIKTTPWTSCYTTTTAETSVFMVQPLYYECLNLFDSWKSAISDVRQALLLKENAWRSEWAALQHALPVWYPRFARELAALSNIKNFKDCNRNKYLNGNSRAPIKFKSTNASVHVRADSGRTEFFLRI